MEISSIWLHSLDLVSNHDRRVACRWSVELERRGLFVCLPSIIDSLKGKSFSQPDGTKVIAKRKAVTVRWGLKEARSNVRADV